MSKIKMLKDALVHELKDIYSAELQMAKLLPKVVAKVSNERLEEVLVEHVKETGVQIQRLEKIQSIVGEKLTGKTCLAMKGLIEEATETLEEETDNESILDALIASAAQRIEHYEISAYGSARAIAEELEEDEIVKLLQETLDEEGVTDRKLSLVCEEEILPDANGADEMEDAEPAASPA